MQKAAISSDGSSTHRTARPKLQQGTVPRREPEENKNNGPALRGIDRARAAEDLAGMVVGEEASPRHSDRSNLFSWIPRADAPSFSSSLLDSAREHRKAEAGHRVPRGPRGPGADRVARGHGVAASDQLGLTSHRRSRSGSGPVTSGGPSRVFRTGDGHADIVFRRSPC